MKNVILAVLLLTSVSLLTGCGLFSKKVPASGTEDSGAAVPEDTTTSGYNSDPLAPAVEIGDAGAGSSSSSSGSAGGGLGNIVYFEFDSVEISETGRAVINQSARFLAANPAARARLEGHADERGTREYNVGLGERRANTVLQALLSAGANAAQLSVVSYGEERPAVPGHDESAWIQNRRVEIVR